MLDSNGNNSFDHRPEIDNSFDSSRAGGPLINGSLANSLHKANPLTLSHDEPR